MHSTALAELKEHGFTEPQAAILWVLNEWERERDRRNKEREGSVCYPLSVNQVLNDANPLHGWERQPAREGLERALVDLMRMGTVRLMSPETYESIAAPEGNDAVVEAVLWVGNLTLCPGYLVLPVD